MKKKKRVVGTQPFINRSTGEIVEMQIMETDEYEKDSNFHKLFLDSFIDAFECIANRKTALCFWMISNLTKDNLLLYTYRQIADKTGCSYKTVADTMQVLLSHDFMRRLGSGHYMVNPNIIFKGSYPRRSIALNKYAQAEYGDTPDSQEIRLQTIKNSIKRLKKQEEALQNKIAYAKLLDDKNPGEKEV